MKTTISTESTTYTYGIEGIYEYLWDGKMSKEELEEKADAVMSKVVDMINNDGFTWDTTHGILEYNDEDYETSDDAIEEFLDDKEKFIRQVVKEMEIHEAALADLMREMISLGWTLESFNEDFDNFESDEVTPDEKETCRKIFENVWEDVQEEILDKAPDTCILRHHKLSDIYVGELILSWYGDVEISKEEVEDLKTKLVGEVNNHLPEHMYWVIETSEIMGKVGQAFDIEDFDALFDKAFDKILG